MINQRVKISGIGHYLPPSIRSSSELEKLIAMHSPKVKIASGIVEAMTGIKTRRVASDNQYSSDMAALAALNLFKRYLIKPSEIDLLVFASASQDLAEPATGNIVQEMIGTSCPIFDIKNACNSFLNGLEVSEALIHCGKYKRVLVVTGETPSKCIKYSLIDREDLRLSFSGFTFGDGGAAVLLEQSDDNQGFTYDKFQTVSKYWEIGTLASGGTRHPRGDEHTYFRGDGSKIKDAFIELGPNLIRNALKRTETSFADYKKVFVHQVSVSYLHAFIEQTGFPIESVATTIENLGNLAAASMPIALSLAIENDELNSGDKIMFVGLAGGISLGVFCYQF